jgi:hypothetical protein
MNLLLHSMLAVYASPFLFDCGSQSAAASCTSGMRYMNPLCCIPYASHSQRVAAVLLIPHAAPCCGQGCSCVMAVCESGLEQLLLQWLLLVLHWHACLVWRTHSSACSSLCRCQACKRSPGADYDQLLVNTSMLAAQAGCQHVVMAAHRRYVQTLILC